MHTHTCIHAHIHTHYIHTHACMHTYTQQDTHTCKQAQIQQHTHNAGIHTHASIHIYTYTIHTHMQTNTCMHAHTHSQTCTHTYPQPYCLSKLKVNCLQVPGPIFLDSSQNILWSCQTWWIWCNYSHSVIVFGIQNLAQIILWLCQK